MKRTFFKFKLGIVTFLIAVIVVGITYFLVLKSRSQQVISNAGKHLTVVMPTFENPCDYPKPKNKLIDAKEAVQLAECFIIQNGYTELPPIADKSKLTPENVFPIIDEEGLKMRHNSLERKGYSYERSNIYDGSWEIMFLYVPHPEIKEFYGKGLKNIGRAVVMDYYGEYIFIQHSNQPLNMPNAKIINQQSISNDRK